MIYVDIAYVDMRYVDIAYVDIQILIAGYQRPESFVVLIKPNNKSKIID